MIDHASASTELADLLGRARRQAKASGRHVLVSAVERVPSLDPLAVLTAIDDASRDDTRIATLQRASRMFWTQPRDEVALAALGAAAVIAPSGGERFQTADREWRALALDACVSDDAPRGLPVGPVLLGGFSFDPDGPHTELWRGFSSTHLVVPAFHVVAAANGCWITSTTVVSSTGDTSVDVELLSRLRKIALDAANATSVATETPRHPTDTRAGHATAARADEASADDWRALVRDAVSTIRAGEMKKVVLARSVRSTQPTGARIAPVLAHLRAAHVDAYVFAIWRGDNVFVGASPERLVRVRDGVVDVSSLAGSARRGTSALEDDALATELLGSAKDRDEHAMVRETLGEMLATLCDDVTFPAEPALLTLPHVHHLHTPLRARLRAGSSLLQLAGALHPTPAVGGTPRDAALQFIRDRERLDRGWYAAPVGWIGRDDGELAVALRSALVSANDATLFAGCGIVAGSDPERELAESEVKLRAMRAGLAAGGA